MSGTLSGLFFPSCALMFSLLLLVVFVLKRKVRLNENNLYVIMLISISIDSLCVLLLQIIANMNVINDIEIFGYIFNKLDFVCLITYAISLFVYVLLITIENIKSNYRNVTKYGSLIYLLLALIIIVSPLELIKNGDYRSVSGFAASITFGAAGVCILLSFLVTIFNYKKINKKHLPALLMPLALTAILILYLVNPYFVIISIILTFMNYVMFFTIENPDYKVIGELSEAKKKAEKYVNEKEIFAFNMSQKIKEPISDIDELCEELENENDIDELKEGIRDIKLSASKIVYLVSDTISGIGTAKIDIKDNDYNANNLFMLVNQSVKTNASKYNVTLYEGKYNKDTFVNGDDLKIKQVVSSFALQLIKLISGRSISLNTTVIPKEDKSIVSFKLVIPNINLTLEELNKNEELEKYEDINFEQISLSKLKKLINLLDGYIEIKSTSDEKLEITINFEQKNIIIQDKDSLKYINEYEKNNKDKLKILIVDDNEEKESLSRFVSRLKYDVTVAKNGEDCLNLVRNNNKYDLILLDDDLDKLDTITIFDRLKSIEGFNTPVIYVGDISNKEKEEDLLDIGFSAILLKPIKQKEIDEIIDKYVK